MNEDRILLLAPVGRDAQLAHAALEKAGLQATICPRVDHLCAGLLEGAGAAILTEEALTSAEATRLVAALQKQPPWSDLPLIIFGSRETVLGSVVNVTLLDRPVRMRTLLSAVRAALRARHRQYQVRDLLEAMEQSVRDRDQFLAMLGHELRNPLAAIVTSSELMERRGGDTFKRERAVINRQARHLARLVDDLLDVSRITRGKIAVHEEPVDFTTLVQHTIQNLEKAALTQGVEVRASLGTAPLVLPGDLVRLQQVVSNLLSNAIKYTNPGGAIDVSLGVEGDRAVLRVRDTGVGISREMLPRIFDLFTQAPGAIDRAQGGMGIGLTLVKRLVELHQGTVEAHSEGLGLGSEFVIRLPLRAATQAPSDVPGAPVGVAPLRVVLAEDNPDARDVLQVALEQLGHRVETCPDGSSAIDRALARPPDAMVIDLGLPGADGFAVARAVRGALGPRVRLVALTGYGQVADREQAFEAGFDSFLVKPVEIEAIDRALRAPGDAC